MDKKFKAACLAAGLATAWGSTAMAAQPVTSIHLTADSTTGLTNVHFFLFGNNNSFTSVTATSISDFPADPLLSDQSFFAPVPSGGVVDGYGVIGNYSSGLVGLSTTTSEGSFLISNPSSFSAVFPNFTEAQISTALVNNDTSTLDSFFGNYNSILSSPLGVGEDLINFSNSSNGGTVTANVPEPAVAGMLLAVGLSGLSRRRRS